MTWIYWAVTILVTGFLSFVAGIAAMALIVVAGDTDENTPPLDPDEADRIFRDAWWGRER